MGRVLLQDLLNMSDEELYEYECQQRYEERNKKWALGIAAYSGFSLVFVCALFGRAKTWTPYNIAAFVVMPIMYKIGHKASKAGQDYRIMKKNEKEKEEDKMP